MKLTNQIEAEIKQVMDDYWKSYFDGNLDHWANYLVDDYRNIGGTEEEIWNSKKEILDYTNGIIDQMQGATELRNKQTQMIPYDPYIMVHELLDIFIKIDDEWTFYQKFRLSSLIQKTDEGWKVLHQHGSYPDSKTKEGEAFAFDTLKNENQKLQKAISERTIDLENKNWELAIEAALERVRAVSLTMNEPADMLNVCRIISDQLLQLGFKEIRNVQTVIIYEQKHTYLNYQYFTPYDKTSVERIDYHLQPDVQEFTDRMLQSADAYYTKIFEGGELKIWREYRRKTNQLPDPKLDDATSAHYYFYSIGAGALGVTTYSALSEDQIALFKRFRNVFELAYRRFLDIEKAEAQAREAKIEAALERVRSRTMAMQRSDELLDVATVLFQQVKALGVPQWNCGFNIWDIGDKEFTYYPGSPDGIISASPCKIPLTEHPVFMRFDESRKRGDELLIYEKQGEEQADHYRYMLSLPVVGDFLRSMLDAGFQLPTFQIDHLANFAYGNLLFITYEDFPEMHDVFKRFARVFEQTYTRFLDLQKAEAQAREAQIEYALEKVRSRTMAMQKGEELKDVVVLLYKELIALGITNFVTCGYVEINEQTGRQLTWVTGPGGDSLGLFYLPLTGDATFDERYAAWKQQQTVFHQTVAGEIRSKHFEYAITTFNSKEAEGMVLSQFPDPIVFYCFNFSHGYLHLVSGSELKKEEEALLARFTRVFEQTYARFLDLQKAEAQAREAQIEYALEKVRSRSMGMQKSEELKDVIQVVYQQFVQLDILVEHTGFLMDYKASDDMNIWLADSNHVYPMISIPYFDSQHWNSFNEAKAKGVSFFSNRLDFKEKNSFYKTLFQFIPPLPDEVKNHYLNCPALAISTVLLDNVGLYIENFSGTPYPDEENAILLRFGKVFQQTYTRFLDLQKAEAQAREAKIEAALERIRARAMAMHSSDELIHVANIMREQMGLLGAHQLETIAVHLYKNDSEIFDSWYAFNPGNQRSGKIVTGTAHFSKNSCELLREIINGYHAEINEYTIEASGAKQAEWAEVLFKETPAIAEGMNYQWPEHVYFHMTDFSGGSMVSVFHQQPNDESKALQKRCTAVFDLAFRRFLDLQKAEAQALKAEQDLIAIKEAKQKAEDALTELQAAQKQLIQSEKMASLGELTAGIAHEIQNPLNFVNNFSEVSNEMIKEIQEERSKKKEERDEALENEILEDISKNLEKISHHGKRADSIVKGMLQHSRSSSGSKELTDINALCDEFLRLAYHGLRAKDKSFNANFETDFDKKIGKISVVPQDMGRVIMNLITNAFYAVNERKQQQTEGYQPKVSISTKKEGNQVFISVKDNGNGIPASVKEKIFQPFFTTKPTGQGTGLGLSLSYDIIKAHGGELKVETKEMEGTTFIISLLVNTNE